MSILVCAATQAELSTTLPSDARSCRLVGVRFVVIGVGVPVALACALRSASQGQVGHIFVVGIAGAYPSSGLQIGDVVVGASQVYGDIGFEQRSGSFQSIQTSPFRHAHYGAMPLADVPQLDGARRRGCTVSTCTGTLKTALEREAAFGAEYETMEGAAVAQAGVELGIAVSEIRAISNIASERDMRPENIARALAELRGSLSKVFPWI